MEYESFARLETQLHLINLYVALERVDWDMGLLGAAAQDFLDTYEDSYQAVVRAAEAKNAQQLQLSAHSLKGAVRNFGADAAQAAAYRLEVMGRLSLFEGSDAALICLQVMLEDLTPELERVARVKNEHPRRSEYP